MKKLLICIIKIPIFILRSINAALMRLPICFIISVIAYAGIFLTDIFDVKWIGVDGIVVHIAVAAVISLVWGIVYTLSKPPLIKKIYSNASAKSWAGFLRLICGFLLSAYAYLSKNLPVLPKYYLLFFGGELVLNALLIFLRARTKTQLAKAMGKYQAKSSVVPSSKEAGQDYAKQSLIDDFKSSASAAGEIKRTDRTKSSTSTAKERIRNADSSAFDPAGEIKKIVEYHNELIDMLYDVIKLTIGETSYIENDETENSLARMKFLAFPYKGAYVETDAVVVTENGVFNISYFAKRGACTIKNKRDGELYAKYQKGDDSTLKKHTSRCKNVKNALSDLLGENTPIFNVMICADAAIDIKTDENANILVTTPSAFIRGIQSIKLQSPLSEKRVSEIKDILNSSKLTGKQAKELKKYE